MRAARRRSIAPISALSAIGTWAARATAPSPGPSEAIPELACARLGGLDRIRRQEASGVDRADGRARMRRRDPDASMHFALPLFIEIDHDRTGLRRDEARLLVVLERSELERRLEDLFARRGIES